MTLHLHHLRGCSPAPLANYLKALGILRLVSEQADATARGWWQDEHFCLLSKMSEEELEAFFLERYQPTPMLSPWNKGCGFFKADDPGMAPLESSVAPRFRPLRDGIAAGRALLDEVSHADAVIRAIKARTKTNKSFQSDEQRTLLAESETYSSVVESLRTAVSSAISDSDRDGLEATLADVEGLISDARKPPTRPQAEVIKKSAGYKQVLAVADRRFKSLKATLIPDCQSAWRGPHSDWLATAVVLDEDGQPDWPSLLGTGGNDGNLDFTNNMMQRLVELFDLGSPHGVPTSAAWGLLKHSIWSLPSDQLTGGAVGQFQPGSAGGANSTTGADGSSLVNAWDFVLMMEGSILLRSLSTRRLDPNALAQASAPFAVRADASGHASPGTEKAQRGEQWMPIWSRPSNRKELAALFGEARVQLGRQTAHRPVDVVRAISRLGAARGIESFTRYGYLERNGQSTLAVPLGRINVRHHPRAFLIDDIAQWMDRLQYRARDKNATARFVQAERRLGDSVLAALTHDWDPSRWQAILLAAVEIEHLQATGSGIEAGPMPPLSPEWLVATCDHSPEFRLAAALGSAAGGYSESRPVNPVRAHCLPLDEKSFGRKFKTSDKRLLNDPRVVVSGRDAILDCAAIVERRLIEAGQKAQRSLPLMSAFRCGARFGDLAGLVAGQFDVGRTFNLARAFMAIRWDRMRQKTMPKLSAPADCPPEAWLALRLCCLPWPLSDGKKIPAETSIVRRLLSGDVSSATEIAFRRLRAAGLRVPLQSATTDPETARLWAAALVFPIDRDSADRAAAILDPSLKGPVHA